MSADDASLEELEKRVARLERIVATLAEKLEVRTDNPNDRRSTTQKIKYDWQQRQ